MTSSVALQWVVLLCLLDNVVELQGHETALKGVVRENCAGVFQPFPTVEQQHSFLVWSSLFWQPLYVHSCRTPLTFIT
uniref:Putative secreted protein n=1 Tax=Ixodes ricinus TaxID=34613 RepID=A0A6B0U4Q7_IXORI